MQGNIFSDSAMRVYALIRISTVLIVAVALGIQVCSASTAFADPALPPDLLTTIGSGSGSGAGALTGPGAVAASPNKPGHIYVVDRSNRRISEFTAWGDFVKAFGWGVADGTSPELQTCTTTCFKGLSGTGAGQFQEVNGITVDGNGDIYAFESAACGCRSSAPPAPSFGWREAKSTRRPGKTSATKPSWKAATSAESA